MCPRDQNEPVDPNDVFSLIGDIHSRHGSQGLDLNEDAYTESSMLRRAPLIVDEGAAAGGCNLVSDAPTPHDGSGFEEDRNVFDIMPHAGASNAEVHIRNL